MRNRGPKPRSRNIGRPEMLIGALTVVTAAAAILCINVAYGGWRISWSGLDSAQDEAVRSTEIEHAVTSVVIESKNINVAVGFADIGDARMDFDADGSGVHVAESIRHGTLQIKIPADGRRAELQGAHPPKLTLRLPMATLSRRIPLSVQSDSADISASGTFGAVHLTSQSGDIQVAGRADNIVIQTTSGDVTTRGGIDVAGQIVAKTESGDGSYAIRSAQGAVKLTSTSGDIVVKLRGSGYVVAARSKSGSMHDSFVSGPNAATQVAAQSDSGDIAVEPYTG